MKKFLVLILTSVVLAGCTSTNKDVYTRLIKIESNPEGAMVIFDGAKLGKTPISVNVETTENGCFVRNTAITLIPADDKCFTQVKSFPAYKKGTSEDCDVPEKIIFDLTKNPEKEQTITLE